MSSPFSFANLFKSSPKWEGTTLNHETVKLTHNEKENSVTLEVKPPQQSLFARLRSLFSANSPAKTPVSGKTYTFTNIDRAKFESEKAKLPDLVKKSNDITALIQAVQQDFAQATGSPTKPSLPSTPPVTSPSVEEVQQQLQNKEKEALQLKQDALQLQLKLEEQQKALKLHEENAELRRRDEESRAQIPLPPPPPNFKPPPKTDLAVSKYSIEERQKAIAELHSKIDGLTSEIKSAKEEAAKIKDVQEAQTALKTIEETAKEAFDKLTILEKQTRDPKISHKNFLKTKEEIANSGDIVRGKLQELNQIQKVHKESAQQLLEELKAQASDISETLKQFPEGIQSTWASEQTKWQSGMEDISSLSVAKAKQTELEKLIQSVASLCKSDALATIDRSELMAIEALEPEFTSSLLTEERLVAINTLRATALDQRRKTWDSLTGEGESLGIDLNAITAWNKKVEAEANNQAMALNIISDVQNKGAVSTDVLNAAGSAIAHAASTVADWFSRTPSHVKAMDAFEGVVQECVNKTLSISGEESKEVAEVFIQCRSQEWLGKMYDIRDDFESIIDPKNTHPDIAALARRSLSEFRAKTQITKAEFYEDVPKEWAQQRNEASILLHNMKMLTRLSDIYNQYKEQVPKTEELISRMTGPEKIQAERILNELRIALDPSQIIDNPIINPNDIDEDFEARLIQITAELKDLAAIQGKKEVLRAAINTQLETFGKFIDDYTKKIEEIEKAYGVKLDKPRADLKQKRAQLNAWKQQGHLPSAYQYRLMPGAFIPYSEAMRTFLSKSYVGTTLPTIITSGLASSLMSAAAVMALRSSAMMGGPSQNPLESYNATWSNASNSTGVSTHNPFENPMSAPWEDPAATWSNAWNPGGVTTVVSAGMFMTAAALTAAAMPKRVKLDDLSLEQIPAYLARVKAEVDIQMYDFESTTGIKQAYEANQAYLDKKEEADALAIQLMQSKPYNRFLLQKGVKEIETNQQKRLESGNMSSRDVLKMLKTNTASIASLMAKAESNDMALIVQIKDLDKEAKTIEKTFQALSGKEGLSPQETTALEEAKSERENIQNLLSTAKQLLIQSLDKKAIEHQNEINRLYRPIQSYPAASAKVTSIINDSIRRTTKGMPAEVLREHMSSLFSNTYESRIPISSEALKELTPDMLSKYQKSMERMIAKNSADINVFAEAATKAKRGETLYQTALSKAQEQAEDLDENNQLFVKAKLEAKLDKVEEKLKEKKEKSFGPWVTIPYVTNTQSRSVYKSLESLSIAYGMAAAEVTQAANQSKFDPDTKLDIPDQIERIGYEPAGEVWRVQEALGERFTTETANTLASQKSLLASNDQALRDAISNSFITENSSLHNEINKAIEKQTKEVEKLSQYRHSYQFVDKWFGWTGLTRTPVNKLDPVGMRHYQKDLQAMQAKIADLEDKYPLKSIMEAKTQFDASIQNAKNLAERWRTQGKHLYAHQLESQAENLAEKMKEKTDRLTTILRMTSPTIAELKEVTTSFTLQNLEIQKTITEVSNLVEIDRRAAAPLSYQRQYEELIKMDDTPLRESSLEALKNGAIEAVKNSLEEHNESMKEFQGQIEEINHEFQLPADWMKKLSKAVEEEKKLHNEQNQTFTGSWGFGMFNTKKPLDQLDAKEAAQAATKVAEIADASLEKVKKPSGINLKSLQEKHALYKKANEDVVTAKEKLLRDKQFLYLSTMEETVKTALEDVEGLKGTKTMQDLQAGLVLATKAIQTATVTATTAPALTLTKQSETMAADSPQAPQLCRYVGDEYAKRISDKQTELRGFKDNFNKMSIALGFPLTWTNEVKAAVFKPHSDALKDAAKGVRVQESGILGTKTVVKPLSNISLTDIPTVERTLETIEGNITNSLTDFQIKTLDTQYQNYEKQLQAAYKIQADYAANSDIRLGSVVALIDRVKRDVANAIIPADPTRDGMDNTINALRAQTTSLLAGLEGIRRVAPATYVSRMQVLDPTSNDYKALKKELREYAKKELTALKDNYLKRYEERIDNIQANLQKLSGTPLPPQWAANARAAIHAKLAEIETWKTGVTYPDGHFEAFENLDFDGLSYYENAMRQMMGYEISFIEKRPGATPVHTPHSAMKELEDTLEIELIDRELRKLDVDFTNMTRNLESTSRNQPDLQKHMAFKSLEESSKKLLSQTLLSMTDAHNSSTLVNALQMTRATVIRADNQFRLGAAITLDPWGALQHFETARSNVAADRDTARQHIANDGYEILYTTSEPGPNGFNIARDNRFTSRSIEAVADDAVAFLNQQQVRYQGWLAAAAVAGIPVTNPGYQVILDKANTQIPLRILRIQATVAPRGGPPPIDPLHDLTSYDDLIRLRNNVLNTTRVCMAEFTEFNESLAKEAAIRRAMGGGGGGLPPP